MNKSQIASMIAEGNLAFEQDRDLSTIRAVADSLPREEPAPEQPEDAHLESDYEDRQWGGFDDDWASRYDDDPSPYSGDYSEE